MTALTAAAVLAMAAQCAPNVAATTLLPIARVESQLDPLALHDNATGAAIRPATQDEAIATAGRLIAAGHSLDIGLMQINSANFGWLGLSLPAAFNPCVSLRAGAEVLTAYSRYNTGDPRRGFANGYVQRVAAAAAVEARQEIAAADPSSSPPKSSDPNAWNISAEARQERANRAASSLLSFSN